MDAQHQICHRDDGSVDFDFYRREAFLLRRAARRKIVKQLASRLGGFARPIIVLVIVALAIAMPSSAPGAAMSSGISAR